MPSLLQHLEDYFVYLFTAPPITYGTVGAKGLSTNRFYPSTLRPRQMKKIKVWKTQLFC